MRFRVPRSPISRGSLLDGLKLAFAFVLALVVLLRITPKHDAAIVGREAPDFALPLELNGGNLGPDGATLAVRELRGNAVLLDFWATWCGPCREQAHIVDEVSRRWRDRGVVVVGVNTDSAEEGDPRLFALQHHLTYAIVHDPSGAVSRSYGVDTLPTLVVLSRSGKVSAVRMGVTEGTELDGLIQEAL